MKIPRQTERPMFSCSKVRCGGTELLSNVNKEVGLGYLIAPLQTK